MVQVFDQTAAVPTKRVSAMLNPDPFCPVQLAVIEHRGKPTDRIGVEVLNPTTNEFELIPRSGSIHSRGYRLVTNKQLHDITQAVIEKTGYNFRPLMKNGSNTFWDGKKFAERWYAPEVNMSTGASTMMLGIEMRNSYDGTSQVRMAFFAMHLACTNQFHSTNILGEPYEFAHYMSGGGDYIRNISERILNSAGQFGRMAPAVKQLQASHVDGFQGFLDLRKRMVEEAKVDLREKDLLDELSGRGITSELKLTDVKYDDPSSYWDIANAYTALTTHDVGGIRGSDQSSKVVDWLVQDACRA